MFSFLSEIPELLRIRDKRLYVLYALLLVMVSYFGYRAVNGLVGDHDRPLYENAPPAAFAAAPPTTIVDASALQRTRLPDAAYVAALDSARDLGRQAASLSMTQRGLTTAGLSTAAAEQALSSQETLRSQVANSQGNLQAPTISSTTSTGATLTSSVSYNLGSGAPLIATVTITYQVQGARVRPSALAISGGSVGG